LETNLKKSQLLIPWDLGDYNIQTSKFFFWMSFSVNFFTPKLMKIRWSFLFFGSSPHFQIKLSTHGSNLNSIFVFMSELELFFLTGILTQNFNTVDLVKFLEKKSKPSHLDCGGHIEGDTMQNHEKKNRSEKVYNQDSMGKTNFFYSTLSLQPFWAAPATCSRKAYEICSSLV
jgi:hypothetical protein